MRKELITILLLFVAICVPARISFSATYYQDKVFLQNTVLRTTNQSYYFFGNNTIPEGITVIVEKGTKLYIDGNITVLGKLSFEGEKDLPVVITQTSVGNPSIDSEAWGPSNKNPITLIGGELLAEHAQFIDLKGVVDAFATSSIIFDSVLVSENRVGKGVSSISVFNNSTITIKNSILKNISSKYGIEVFNKSFLDIKNTTFTSVGTDSTLYVYGNGTTASIVESRFYGLDLSTQHTSTANISSLQQSYEFQPIIKSKTALQIFSGAYADISITDFESFDTSAISAFSSAQLTISKTTFTKNGLGIKSFNSNISIGDSDIFENINQGAVLYGGNIRAIDNWWGSETGPKSITLNPGGAGDIYEGTANISPWKKMKQKKPKCCSSILFIPGHQGSRIYKRGILTENQLWEPNTTSDIKKLFLNQEGQTIDKTLYLRDIIDRTNIVYGGSDDIEIYKGLIKSLNGLNSNYSIEDWQYAAYDWRMSPNTIVTAGGRFDSPVGQYKRMEEQIIKMADISKTKKVTLLAHSYGGLVTKRLLAYLAQKGKIGLIDKVIFVAVPELGSPSSLFALLHGDNQEVGNGYIVNQSTMRSFAQNMPSAYALLPKADQELIVGIQATNTIAVSVPSISTIPSMYRFLFNEISRPSTKDPIETNIPFIANKKVKDNLDLESGLNYVKSQDDNVYTGIEFYNILGVGLNTPESISYAKKSCSNNRAQFYAAPLILSSNCGLDHIQNFSYLGDGVVLAGDIFTQKQIPSEFDRWGEKYIFNIAEYNRKDNKNYSHANVISAPPVISTIMQMVMNSIGEYPLPNYITSHGGKRMGGNGLISSGSYASNVDSNQSTLQNLGRDKKYQISVSDTVAISGLDEMKKSIGMDFALINNLDSAIGRQIIPTKNTSPNSTMSHVGGSFYIHTESLPTDMNINLMPGSVSSNSSFDLNIQEIIPIAVSSSTVNQNGSISNNISTIASFKDIPITEYSNVIVQTSITATSTVFKMNIVDTYNDIFTSTSTYIVDTSISSNAVLITQGAQDSGYSTNQSNGTPNQTPSGFIDVSYLISRIKTEIQNSGVRSNFKQRYIIRLASIEKNYNSTIESRKLLARKTARNTTQSLGQIIKDLSRSKALNYTGGMKRAEAVFLYSQFFRISRAFGD